MNILRFHNLGFPGLLLALLGTASSQAASPPRGYSIPTIDLAAETNRQVIVDREPGQYLGHPTTVLLEDGKTILTVYPKGYGKGPIVFKRSTDGGLTWSDRLPVPSSWATSKETPSIHRVVDAAGKKRLIVWSGLHPARLAVSEDDGKAWSELKPAGDWGGIVVMGFTEPIKTGAGHYLAMFHDDGRFFTAKPAVKKPAVMTLYKTFSQDGGLTWSAPETVFASSEVHLCEPGFIRSPDGKQIAVLLRENKRVKNSHVIFSGDEGKTWTTPRELPGALTGDRHTGRYAPDGRLFISFRDTTLESPTKGDWVAWVGTYDDIAKGREGQYRVRLMDNTKSGDCAYPGVEVLPDGTFVTTTYGHWTTNQQPYIASVRLKLAELDAKPKQAAVKPVPVPADPRVFRKVLRRLGDDGVHTYRIPGLATTPKGTLLAVFDIRHKGSADLPADIDVGLMRSIDDGETWSAMQRILDFDAKEPGSRGNGVGDPSILVDAQTGSIFVAGLWSKGNRGWNGSGPGMTPEQTGQFVLTKSTDDGVTWSKPINITTQVKRPEWKLCFQGPGAGIQLRDGTLVFPAQFKDTNGAHSCFIYSADHGATWEISPPAIPVKPQTSESQIAELADGSLLLSMRNEARTGQRTWAQWTWQGDLASGQWSAPWFTVPDPTCMASLVRHPHGELLFSNPNSATRQRVAMTIRASTDGGRTWSAGRLLDARPSSYSCLTVLRDGRIGILYETGDVGCCETLTFARFPLEWVTENDR